MKQRLLSALKEGYRALRDRQQEERPARLEHFGAIAQLATPRALVFVDRDYARELGMDGGALWQDESSDGEIGAVPLVAPLEAHLQLTNRCDAGCKGCYTAATPNAWYVPPFCSLPIRR